MYIEVNGRWHYVVWTDPDYVSFHGEMLHKTRCGLLQIRVSYAHLSPDHRRCQRCEKLLAKDLT